MSGLGNAPCRRRPQCGGPGVVKPTEFAIRANILPGRPRRRSLGFGQNDRPDSEGPLWVDCRHSSSARHAGCGRLQVHKSRDFRTAAARGLQVPSKIHVLMKDAHNQDTSRGLAVEDRMACGFNLPVAWSDIARVASEVGKFRQYPERFVQPQDVLFGAGGAPSLQGELGDRLDVGIGFARQGVVTHASCRCVPLPPPICRGRHGR